MTPAQELRAILAASGLTAVAAAGLLHCSEVTVRRYLARADADDRGTPAPAWAREPKPGTVAHARLVLRTA